MKRRAARIDANQVEIVKALRSVGCSVQSLAAVGNGCPDLLVARNGLMWLMEIKDGSVKPSARRLTPPEQKWHLNWKAPVFTVLSVDDALNVLGEKQPRISPNP